MFLDQFSGSDHSGENPKPTKCLIEALKICLKISVLTCSFFFILFAIIYPIVFVALYTKKIIALFSINSINKIRLQKLITNTIVLVVFKIKKNQMLFTFDLILCAFNS